MQWSCKFILHILLVLFCLQKHKGVWAQTKRDNIKFYSPHNSDSYAELKSYTVFLLKKMFSFLQSIKSKIHLTSPYDSTSKISIMLLKGTDYKTIFWKHHYKSKTQALTWRLLGYNTPGHWQWCLSYQSCHISSGEQGAGKDWTQCRLVLWETYQRLTQERMQI